MPRKQLSEFRSKTILNKALNQPYEGWEVKAEDNWRDKLGGLPEDKTYVVKVDQAEKGRFKKGLVKLNRSKSDLVSDIEAIFAGGYTYVIVEPYQEHEQVDERYLAMERTRDGLKVSYSASGGIDIEAHPESITSSIYNGQPINGIGIPDNVIKSLADAFEGGYFSFLEINPLVVKDNAVHLLDAAVEVDNEAEFFESDWQENDLRRPKSKPLTEEELTVRDLAEKSQASFSLEVINPDGSIFVLLSGGGASVVVADEVFNLGQGKELANYGEYSDNPNLEETRLYTEQIVKLLLKSQETDKVLIIGGGVANFTDVRVTFKGVIGGMKPHIDELRNQGVKVYVRHGGPHEKEGLAAIKDFFDQAGIAGQISGPQLLLSDIVKIALDARKKT
jgi:succinyl-CoA synthetase beta subunit